MKVNDHDHMHSTKKDSLYSYLALTLHISLCAYLFKHVCLYVYQLDRTLFYDCLSLSVCLSIWGIIDCNVTTALGVGLLAHTKCSCVGLPYQNNTIFKKVVSMSVFTCKQESIFLQNIWVLLYLFFKFHYYYNLLLVLLFLLWLLQCYYYLLQLLQQLPLLLLLLSAKYIAMCM